MVSLIGGNWSTSNEGMLFGVDDSSVIESHYPGSCKQYLKDYDAFADQYVEVSKKYKANPEDPSLVKEYTDLAAKAMKWSEQAPDDCNAMQKIKMAKISTKIAGAMK